MRRICLAITLWLVASGCARYKHSEAPHLYYAHLYTEARAVARPDAADRDSPDVVLDNMRLGLASLAWGDLDEAERALLAAYEYLTSGKVNDPTRAAFSRIGQEGVRVWTGEPYERAMCFHYMAVLYMLKGEWDNARAAARNSLFSLKQFDAEGEAAVATIESQFTLGYLVLGLSQLMTGHDEAAKRPLQRVEQLRPDLAPLVATIRGGSFDTLLLVDTGRGPRKVAVGTAGSEVRLGSTGRVDSPSQVRAAIDGHAVELPTSDAVVDLWALAQHRRWWSLDTLRKAKAIAGDVLTKAGLGAVVVGAAQDSREAVIAGAGAIVAGLLLQASAKADTRHLAMLPRRVYLLPLTLGEGRHDLTLDFDYADSIGATWHNLTGGSPGRPAVYYLRHHDGNYGGMPRWADRPLYFTEHDTAPMELKPYILGGRDLAPPDSPRLIELHRAEGIVFQPGPQGFTDERALDPALYRHVTERGRVLWSPAPGTHGYQKLTRTEHPRYEPRSPTVQQLQTGNEPSGRSSATIEGRGR